MGDPPQPARIVSKVDEWAKTSSTAHKVTFKWTIDHFRSYCGDEDYYPELESPTFAPRTEPKLLFRLQVCPNGEPDHEGHVSIYVFNSGDTEQRVSLSVSILSPSDTVLTTNQRNNVSLRPDAVADGYGWPQFVTKEFLLNQANGMITDDQVIFYCELTAYTVDVTGSKTSIGSRKRVVQNCNSAKIKDSSQQQLEHDCSNLLSSGKFHDVILCIGDKTELPAHKCILATRSPVFEHMFTNNFAENQQNRVLITDTKEQVFGQMLHFIYVGKVKDEKSLSDTDLLIAAEKYQIDSLKEMCEDAISRSLDVQSVVAKLLLSKVHNANNLYFGCINFISDNSAEVFATDAWKSYRVDNSNLAFDILEDICGY